MVFSTPLQQKTILWFWSLSECFDSCMLTKEASGSSIANLFVGICLPCMQALWDQALVSRGTCTKNFISAGVRVIPNPQVWKI